MFNYRLASEIYGGQPWLIDYLSFSSLINILRDMRSGVKMEENEKEKLNTISFLSLKSKTYLSSNVRSLSNLQEGDEVVSIINLNGPITKNGGMSSYGTKYLSSEMDKMTNDERVKGHVIVTDSGGGSSAAVIFMTDSIKKSQALGKPVVQFVEKGGMNASAAYHIGSFSDYIISEDAENYVGSLGTMIEFSGYPQQHTRESDGAVFVRAYATASINKNIEFEEALKGNLEPIISNLLDPTNEQFLANVQANRPGMLTEDLLTGKILRSGEAVGTLIDSIGTFGSAVEKVLELSKSKQIKNFQVGNEKPTKSSLINNKNKSTMDLSTLKSEHKDTYQAAFAEGVAEEQDRVGAWMAHASTDIEEVKAGIASGKPISSTKTQEFLIKANSIKKVADIKSDSAKDLSTDESADKEEEEDPELKAWNAQLDAKLKK